MFISVSKNSIEIFDNIKSNNLENFPENKKEIKEKNKSDACYHIPSIFILNIEIQYEICKEYHVDSSFLYAKFIH